MSEWLDLMLEEIARKQRESREAQDELKRREQPTEEKPAAPASSQSK